MDSQLIAKPLNIEKHIESSIIEFYFLNSYIPSYKVYVTFNTIPHTLIEYKPLIKVYILTKAFSSPLNKSEWETHSLHRNGLINILIILGYSDFTRIYGN